jgi:signal transduction histidine kinase
MREQVRNYVAIGVAVACLLVGERSAVIQRPLYTGVTLGLEGSTIVITSIDPAAGDAMGLQVGMVVTEIEGSPVDGPKRLDLIAQGALGDFSEIGVADSGYVGPKPFRLPFLSDPPIAFTIAFGAALLFGIAAFVLRGHAGEALRPFAIPLAVASGAPLLAVPFWASSPPLVIAAAVLPLVSLLPLADGIIERIASPRLRLAAAVAVGAAALLNLWLVIGYHGLSRQGLYRSQLDLSQNGLADAGGAFLPAIAALAVTAIPGLLLLAENRRARPGAASAPGGPDAASILLAAVTPGVVAFGYLGLAGGVSVPLLWLLVAVVVLQSGARLATLRIQRDTVVAATEIERARLAADLHDDALQEMTLLVRRLDDVGDAQAAELARSIAERLREVCGDLRLPILDELGAGPALEWLVERVGEASGRRVTLERVDAARPPADVELAVFRVAQEALANAVTHGAPPITVRYDATRNRASLSITDHGTGLAPDAASIAGRSGHYGLLNMHQRAEQIGARIDFRRPPDGGTVVGLVWSPA